MRSTVAIVVALLAPAALAQSRKDLPENAPENCAYCEGDPARMEAAGIVSHGGFEFSQSDTASIDAFLSDTTIYWIETAHFQLGFALGPYKPKQGERKKIRAELTRLMEVLPEVNPKAKALDPWLRLHLYAQRVEELWDLFLEIMHVTADQFPDGTKPWVLGEPYFGEGPYLGQKGKYEVLVLSSPSIQMAFLREHFGLSVKLTQKWNVVDTDSLIVVTNIRENDLANDEALHGHIGFSLVHNFIDGYKHYSYDTPLWIKEGLGHYVERRLNPKFNSFSYAEGSIADVVSKSNWRAEAKRLIQTGRASRMAELVRLRSFAEFDAADHVTSWSMIGFLVEQHGDGFACMNARLHGLKTPDGIPDGSNMNDKHRTAFLECIGMGYAQFDTAWREWAVGQ